LLSFFPLTSVTFYRFTDTARQNPIALPRRSISTACGRIKRARLVTSFNESPTRQVLPVPFYRPLQAAIEADGRAPTGCARQTGYVRFKVHYLVAAVGNFSESDGQRTIDQVADLFHDGADGGGGSRRQIEDFRDLVFQDGADCRGGIVDVQVVPNLLAESQRGFFSCQQVENN